MDSPNTTITTTVLFHEEQQFRQLWLWALLLAALAVTVVAFLSVRSFGVVLLVVVVHGVLVWFLYSLKLTTEVRPDGIHIRFFPLPVRQAIPFSQIARYEARTYRPILEYGGWGIRYGWKGKGKAYNVRGNRGVQLELRDSQRLLIGSQRPDELARAIEAGMGGGG